MAVIPFLSMLVASPQAEAVKRITLGLRVVHPGCRIEAVYSEEEALEWALRDEWQIIVADDHLAPSLDAEFLPALRRRAPHSVILALSDNTDAATANRFLRAGADCFLYKGSPAFETELLLAIQGVMTRREFRTERDLAQARYLRLTELFTSVVYELDPEGRFTFLAPSVMALLRYAPDELIGSHFSTLIQEDDRGLADRRFDERRTGSRATRNHRFRLAGHPQRELDPNGIDVEISAQGLYDPRNRFMGTVGIVRVPPISTASPETLRQLEALSRQVEALQEFRTRFTTMALGLSAPVQHVSDQSRLVLRNMQELDVEARLEELTAQAVTIAQSGLDLAASAAEDTSPPGPVNLKALLGEILTQYEEDPLARGHASDLQIEGEDPYVWGVKEQLRNLFRTLLDHGQHGFHSVDQKSHIAITVSPAPSFPSPTLLLKIIVWGAGTTPSSVGRVDHPTPLEKGTWEKIRTILLEHRGSMSEDHDFPHHLAFAVVLPSHHSEPSDAGESPPSPPPMDALIQDDAPSHADAIPTPSSEPLAPPCIDRRHVPRTKLNLEIRLTWQGQYWIGSTSNISPKGLYCVVDGVIPAWVQQPIRVGLVNEAAVLQLEGTVRGLREESQRRIGTTSMVSQGIAVEFEQVSHDEHLVLRSLLDAHQEQHIPLSVTAILGYADSQDLLVEVGQSDAIVRRVPLPKLQEDPSDTDQRFSPRVNYVMLARLDPVDPTLDTIGYRGQTVNLSPTGCSLRLYAPEHLVGRRFCLRLTPGDSLAAHLALPQNHPKELLVESEVVWTRPEAQGPAASAPSTNSMIRAGLRFFPRNLEETSLVKRMVAELLKSPLRIDGLNNQVSLLTSLMTCTNPRGQSIAISYDRPKAALPPASPLVIIAPGFGETKRDYIPLAYLLAYNGFHVLRYDHTHHVGESEGDIADHTLTGMKEDLGSVLTFARHSWPASSLTLISPGLSGRIALKAIAEELPVQFLILVMSMFDIRGTLEKTHQEDLLGAVPSYIPQEVDHILGMPVHVKVWLKDAIDAKFSDLASTLADTKNIRIPMTLYQGTEPDHGADSGGQVVRHALGSLVRHSYTIPDPFYRLHEFPERDFALFRQVVWDCLEQCRPLALGQGVHTPPTRDIRRQIQVEREQARARHTPSKPHSLVAWDTRSDVLSSLEELREPEFRFFDDLCRLIGPIQDSDRILEILCGNGRLPLALMLNQVLGWIHTAHPHHTPIQYVGIDLDRERMVAGNQTLQKMTLELQSLVPPWKHVQGILKRFLACADVNHRLPFQDGQFTRVLCAFGLESVQDPWFTLREGMRVLRPGGKLIIAALNPSAHLASLSSLGRGGHTQLKGSLGKGVLLFSKMSKDGKIHSFDRTELVQLLSIIGGETPRVYSSLQNLAHIAVAEKRSTPFPRDPSAHLASLSSLGRGGHTQLKGSLGKGVLLFSKMSKDGKIHSFDRTELVQLLSIIGGETPRVYSSLQNLAHIAVAEKPLNMYTSDR